LHLVKAYGKALSKETWSCVSYVSWLKAIVGMANQCRILDMVFQILEEYWKSGKVLYNKDFNHNGYKTHIVHQIMNALLRRKVFIPFQLTTLIQFWAIIDFCWWLHYCFGISLPPCCWLVNLINVLPIVQVKKVQGLMEAVDRLKAILMQPPPKEN